MLNLPCPQCQGLLLPIIEQGYRGDVYYCKQQCSYCGSVVEFEIPVLRKKENND